VSNDELISSGIACRKLLSTFARSAAEYESVSASAAGSAEQRGLARRVTEEHRVLQRTLSNLLAAFHALPREAPVDTAAIDLFVIDRNAVDVGLVQAAIDQILRVLAAERDASTPASTRTQDEGGASACDGQSNR
jgi:hypothetical protein